MARVRRALMLPLVVVLEVLLIATSPLTLLATAAGGVLLRSSRPVRTMALLLAYSWVELTSLLEISRGPTDWNSLIPTVAHRLYSAMTRILDLDVTIETGSPTPAELSRSDGLIVLARHCGPGDSLFVVWLLAYHYGLDVRVVLKQALRWEPTLDLAGDHLPLFFVRHGHGGRSLERVRRAATGLPDGSALLLFPEGGNFSWARWQRAIDRLVEQGEIVRARIARRQTHTLPARPGGALAALQAAPDADVLVLAHSGFSPDGRDRPWWRLPVHAEFTMRPVLVEAADVPRDVEGARAFLDRTWSLVDTWVAGHSDLQEAIARPAEA